MYSTELLFWFNGANPVKYSVIKQLKSPQGMRQRHTWPNLTHFWLLYEENINSWHVKCTVHWYTLTSNKCQSAVKFQQLLVHMLKPVIFLQEDSFRLPAPASFVLQ